MCQWKHHVEGMFFNRGDKEAHYTVDEMKMNEAEYREILEDKLLEVAEGLRLGW